MLAMFLLIAAPTGQSSQPAGPAILYIQESTGWHFVPFSSFARCEAARRTFEAENAEYRRNEAVNGRAIVPGTEPRYRCIPG
jgi:hypothetical protein